MKKRIEILSKRKELSMLTDLLSKKGFDVSIVKAYDPYDKFNNINIMLFEIDALGNTKESIELCFHMLAESKKIASEKTMFLLISQDYKFLLEQRLERRLSHQELQDMLFITDGIHIKEAVQKLELLYQQFIEQRAENFLNDVQSGKRKPDFIGYL